MGTIKVIPKVDNWLFNGIIFSEEVTTLRSRVNEWQEVTTEFKDKWESEHPVTEE